jgi:ATP phosphoribosyltransferase regulatory subunit
VARLRRLGETVVCTLPGHEHEVNEFHCDRELIEVGGQWVVQSV